MRAHCVLTTQNFQLREVGGRERSHFHQPLKCGNGLAIRQRGTAGRHHDRIEHDRHAFELLQPVSDRMCGLGRANHADLHRIHANVGDHRVHLRYNHIGGHRVNGIDAQRVLRGNRRDRRHRMATQSRNRLDVGLYTRTAAAIRPGDDEDACGHDASSRLSSP